jgi:uncharacterized cupin superfamily protein
VSGEATSGRFCVIDMHIPPGGGPPPHRHDFEETFILLEGEMEATFRGKKSIVRAGVTLNIPANAPHRFHNMSALPVRLLCICSPAGQERFFMEVGVPVATRTTPPPKLDANGEAAFIEKVKALAPKYHTELLREPSAPSLFSLDPNFTNSDVQHWQVKSCVLIFHNVSNRFIISLRRRPVSETWTETVSEARILAEPNNSFRPLCAGLTGGRRGPNLRQFTHGEASRFQPCWLPHRSRARGNCS